MDGHFGHYQILRTLAFGGMAQVLLARDDDHGGRLVVLKQILPHLSNDKEFVRFFTHEGHLGQRLHHPNLIETLEAGEVSGTSYIALEYLRGRSLIEVLRRAAERQSTLPLGFVVRVVADAARGLHAAHEARGEDGVSLDIIHRDVTPHNLFVCDDGPTKVLDFGIAKAASQLHQTRTGLVKGKFAYLAPEQIRGQPIDRRVDVFALGIVLYELMTQTPLFRGGNDGETLQRVLSLEIVPPERRRRGLPAGFAAVAMRALQRDPERRLPTTLALAEALEAVAAHELVDATPAAVASVLGELFPEIPEEEAVMTQMASSAPATMPTMPVGIQTGSRARLERVARHLGWAVVTAAVVATLVLAVGLRRPPIAMPAPIAVAPAAVAAPALAFERATPVAPPTPAPAPRGTLQIVDERRPVSLRVLVDGQLVDGGTERIWTASLPAGKHRVQASADGHSARVFTVDVGDGATETLRIRAGRGTLRIAVAPWAEVWLDDTKLGVTPLTPVEATEGAHTLTIVNGELGARIKKRITVAAGRETALRVDLFKEAKAR